MSRLSSRKPTPGCREDRASPRHPADPRRSAPLSGTILRRGPDQQRGSIARPAICPARDLPGPRFARRQRDRQARRLIAERFAGNSVANPAPRDYRARHAGDKYLIFHTGMGGRAVEGTGLENRRGCKLLVGSNPTPSATEERRAPAADGPPGECRRPMEDRPQLAAARHSDARPAAPHPGASTIAGWRVLEWADDTALSTDYVYNLLAAGTIESVKVGSARVRSSRRPRDSGPASLASRHERPSKTIRVLTVMRASEH